MLALCLLAVSPAFAAEQQADIPVLVQQAAQPEVLFGSPSRLDSLLVRITAGGSESAKELLDLADTPWAWQFEVIRRALERLGDISRREIITRLADSSLSDRKISVLLVLFEKLGQEGDESFLYGYLRAESRTVVVPALRCLAAFGAPDKTLKRLLPLLGSHDTYIRLAAVWATGELCRRRAPENKEAGQLDSAVRPLLDDPVLQVRLTAAEVLHVLGTAPAPELLR